MTDIESNLSEIEELTQCGHCKRPFNDSTHLPKDLDCKHTFCLECIQTGFGKKNWAKGSSMRVGELYCVLCHRLTDVTENGHHALETNSQRLALCNLLKKLRDKSSLTNGDAASSVTHTHEAHLESCIAHGAPLQLWCYDCNTPLCVDCTKTIHAESRHHTVCPSEQANEQLKKEAFSEMTRISHMDDNVRQLAKRQRQFLFLIRDACNALIREVQTSLDSDWNVDPTAEIREALTPIQLAMMDAKSPQEVHRLFTMMIVKKQALQEKCQEMIIQCQLNDLIGHSDIVYNFDTLHQAVTTILSTENEIKPSPFPQPIQDPILFLTNYCMSQLFSRLPQRPSMDTVLLNHSMQRQLVITSPSIPVDSTPTMSNPPQTAPVSEVPDTFSSPNDSLVSQVEYPSHQPVQPSLSVSFDNQVDVELSRPDTPPDSFSSPPTPEANLSNFTPPPATTAQIVQMQPAAISEQVDTSAPIIHPPVRPVPTRSPANVSPRYFFYISINGTVKGQIVIETRPDVAPKMCRNFDRLTTADRKASYKGCSFFQCWKNESVITGDYEFNTGRGGRSIYTEGYFQPEDTRLPAVRGAVGMRRQQKKHDYFGLVGSQFRIILQDMQGFTGIFGHVVEGIELVDLIASHGDQTGKPVKPIQITRCGKL